MCFFIEYIIFDHIVFYGILFCYYFYMNVWKYYFLFFNFPVQLSMICPIDAFWIKNELVSLSLN